MNKVAQYYRELVASLSERLRNGERDIDALVEQARERVIKTGELTRTEVDELTRAVRRDLEEFAMPSLLPKPVLVRPLFPSDWLWD